MLIFLLPAAISTINIPTIAAINKSNVKWCVISRAKKENFIILAQGFLLAGFIIQILLLFNILIQFNNKRNPIGSASPPGIACEFANTTANVAL